MTPTLPAGGRSERLEHRGFLRDQRGASLVEYIVILGAVALVGIAGFRKFGASIYEKVELQANKVLMLEGATSKEAKATLSQAGASGVFPSGEGSALPAIVESDEYGVGSGTGTAQDALTAAPQDKPAKGEEPAKPAEPAYTISAEGQKQMKALLDEAKKHAAKKKPGGWCYKWVMTYVDAVGYGEIPKGGIRKSKTPAIPYKYWPYAHGFADYMNIVDESGVSNADKLGLQKLPINNPYDAPPGAIVVVRAGAPGTSHPTAGDIAVAAGDGVFYNDGKMGYKGAEKFGPTNDYVLGIYAPK